MEVLVILAMLLFIPLSLYIFIKINNGITKMLRPDATRWEYIGFNIYCGTFIVFVLGFISHQMQYHEQIDIVGGDCYIPFGEKHIYSLVVYFVLYHIALILCWSKDNKLPPLTLVLSMSILMIGIVLNIFIAIQLIGHDLSVIPEASEVADFPIMILFPIVSLTIGFAVFVKILRLEHEGAKERQYSNAFLNKCNQLLSNNLLFCEIIVVIAPLVAVITIILKLFGQDYDSLSKVFTETATWTFSQYIPPPPKDHQGHYLCTVAASGTPSVVKPLREGNRHGYLIMVNRQLQVANAFEELVQDLSPRLHKIIRKNYDKYGYDLCKHITTANRANLIYILMKPLEWVFLISLYLFCVNPEEKIKRQYS